MRSYRGRYCPAAQFSLFILLLSISLPAWSAEKTRLRVDDYQIDAELTPHTHKISAKTKVKFTALDDLSVATFEFNNALRLTKVTDANGKTLSAERVTQDSTVRIPLTAGLPKDSSTTMTFEYEGILDSADESPVQGLKLASIGDDTTYLLYAGRWFPVNSYGLNRFTSTINITIPAHMIAIGSGTMSVADAAPAKKTTGGLEHEDLHLRERQAEFSRHHDRGHFPGDQERRRGRGFARLFQAHPPEAGRRILRDRTQGIHLLHLDLRYRLRPPRCAWSSCRTIPCPPPGRLNSRLSPAAP